MPHQQLVADVGLELVEGDHSLIPAYREVVFSFPRQNGKTVLVLCWEIQRATGWAEILGGPQRMAYSAQDGTAASKKLVEEQFPMLGGPQPSARSKLLGIRQFIKSNGKEQVVWRNGSRLTLLASLEDSGHGNTVGLGVKDELFADKDFRRDQSLIPAMSTVESAQMLAASTAGTADSVAWNDKVDKGRASVDAGLDSGIAYFEWSAPLDADPADPATWWACMPALGRTVGIPAIEHAYRMMKLGEFKRAFLNIPTSADERVIPGSVWDLVCSSDVEATASVFALDCNPERSAAAIVAAGDGPVIEVVDYRPGTGWLIDRAVELHGKYRAAFAIDVAGPAGSFVADLEKRGVPVISVGTREVAQFTGAFYDAVVNEQVKVRRHAYLDEAVAGAAKRSVGDAWVWGRKSSKIDISPLVAATLALGADPPVQEADAFWL